MQDLNVNGRVIRECPLIPSIDIESLGDQPGIKTNALARNGKTDHVTLL